MRLPDTPVYINRRIECMDRAELEPIRLAKLRYRLQFVYERSPFYRRLFDQAGVRPEAIRSLDDFHAMVPFTEKIEIIRDQEEHPPYGDRATVPPRMLGGFSTTGGTSGIGQEIQCLTKLDIVRAAGVRSAFSGHFIAGMRKQGVAPVLFPVSNSGGTWFPFEWIRRAGGMRLIIGHMPTEQRLREMIKYQVTFVGHILPSYLNILSHKARELGIDPTREMPQLQGMMLAGESYPVHWAERMEAFWGCKMYENYGNTQVMGLLANTCERGAVPQGRRGYMHIDEMAFVVEIRDPVTDALVGPGEVGEIVITTLDRIASPYIRFRTKDQGRFLPHTACDCGRTGDILVANSITRLDDMVKIKGNNIWSAALEQVAFATAEVEDFRMHVQTDAGGATVARVHVLLSRALPAAEKERLFADLAGRLREKTNISMHVEEATEPFDSSQYAKVKRIRDERTLKF